MKNLLVIISGIIYKYILRPILFLLDSEKIHIALAGSGELFGKIKLITIPLKYITKVDNKILKQSFFNIKFQNPVGLAAGFDYTAQLTQFLPALGFGFGSIGTITNFPYGGNPKPLFGRLVKSRSLMVNKGFKNVGIERIIKKFRKYSFGIPVGISIGRTNTDKLITQKQSINDIIGSFRKVEESPVKFSYYELNISCPNLAGNISFYEPKQLEELLMEIKRLKLKKPLFVKMPIERTDEETLDMLNVIVKFPVQAVIFGNLQKNRKDPAFDPEEVKKYKTGNFSGKATEKRSNELIRLAYKNFGKSLLIIGCGGIFNANDAYTKIKLGASLVQMITGMIFEGPLLASQINNGLIKLLKNDGFGNISQAIGIDAR
jgi:dihydroorotate dehydrogenase